ncbi:hypothetical protein MIND_00598900 [Mycena indigotica]|uniref:Uncharacterized protein n=1 Tax=Mycena indigotica TaxID=2126181 RepID=A0A8H6SPN1_9AGAR|nr:uncharacterized protein MIND_00598900 [Mycena indigotica]KAF7303695.1 hypothetical protein MIND_00598900 [Mycena indigotica]
MSSDVPSPSPSRNRFKFKGVSFGRRKSVIPNSVVPTSTPKKKKATNWRRTLLFLRQSPNAQVIVPPPVEELVPALALPTDVNHEIFVYEPDKLESLEHTQEVESRSVISRHSVVSESRFLPVEAEWGSDGVIQTDGGVQNAPVLYIEDDDAKVQVFEPEDEEECYELWHLFANADAEVSSSIDSDSAHIMERHLSSSPSGHSVDVSTPVVTDAGSDSVSIAPSEESETSAVFLLEAVAGRTVKEEGHLSIAHLFAHVNYDNHDDTDSVIHRDALEEKDEDESNSDSSSVTHHDPEDDHNSEHENANVQYDLEDYDSGYLNVNAEPVLTRDIEDKDNAFPDMATRDDAENAMENDGTNMEHDVDDVLEDELQSLHVHSDTDSGASDADGPDAQLKSVFEDDSESDPGSSDSESSSDEDEPNAQLRRVFDKDSDSDSSSSGSSHMSRPGSRGVSECVTLSSVAVGVVSTSRSSTPHLESVCVEADKVLALEKEVGALRLQNRLLRSQVEAATGIPPHLTPPAEALSLLPDTINDDNDHEPQPPALAPPTLPEPLTDNLSSRPQTPLDQRAPVRISMPEIDHEKPAHQIDQPKGDVRTRAQQPRTGKNWAAGRRGRKGRSLEEKGSVGTEQLDRTSKEAAWKKEEPHILTDDDDIRRPSLFRMTTLKLVEPDMKARGPNGLAVPPRRPWGPTRRITLPPLDAKALAIRDALEKEKKRIAREDERLKWASRRARLRERS